MALLFATQEATKGHCDENPQYVTNLVSDHLLRFSLVLRRGPAENKLGLNPAQAVCVCKTLSKSEGSAC